MAIFFQILIFKKNDDLKKNQENGKIFSFHSYVAEMQKIAQKETLGQT
jgi:hypothetical protein